MINDNKSHMVHYSMFIFTSTTILFREDSLYAKSYLLHYLKKFIMIMLSLYTRNEIRKI